MAFTTGEIESAWKRWCDENPDEALAHRQRWETVLYFPGPESVRHAIKIMESKIRDVTGCTIEQARDAMRAAYAM